MNQLNITNNCTLFDTLCDIKTHYSIHNQSTLYILGQGFDPRMCESISKINDFISEMDIFKLAYAEGSYSPSEKYKHLAEKNTKKLNSIGRDIKIIQVKRNINLLLFFREKFNIDNLKKKYKRIIVDISAMPQSIFFNLIKYLIFELKRTKDTIKLDIIICENSKLDDAIIPTDLSETAKSLSGFDMFSSDLESDENPIPIWIPLLGKGCANELEKLYSYISPQEICPVLPFPSKDPRRSDEILSFLGKHLFESFSVETRNIIYVAEQNVLDVYSKLYKSIKYYNKVLKIIGDPKFFISIGSSKLIGLGALLVNLELRRQDITAAFAVVENGGYTFDTDKYTPSHNHIYCLSLNENTYGW